jgi:hypothetical protein
MLRRPNYLYPCHESSLEDVLEFIATLASLPFFEVRSRVQSWLIAHDADAMVQEAAKVALEIWPRVDVSPKELRERRLRAYFEAEVPLEPQDFLDIPALRPLASKGEDLPTPSSLREEINRRRVLKLVAACWKLVVEAREGISTLVRVARFGGLLVWPMRDPASGIDRIHFGGPLQALERSTLYARSLCGVTLRALSLPGAHVEITPTRESPSRYAVVASDPLGSKARARAKFDSRLEKACYGALVRAVDGKGHVTREPGATPVGRALAIPDFGIVFHSGGPSLALEVVGFWTEAYLARKRELLEHPACRHWGFLVHRSKFDAFVEGFTGTARQRVFPMEDSIDAAELGKWLGRISGRSSVAVDTMGGRIACVKGLQPSPHQ